MAGKPGRSGGARPGAGRKRKSPLIERQPRIPRVGVCWVYVVHEADEPTVCKIGVALDVPRRFSSLQVGTWRILKLAHACKMPSEDAALAVERAAHQALAALHCRGEWFRVAPDRAVAEVRLAADQLEAAFVAKD